MTCGFILRNAATDETWENVAIISGGSVIYIDLKWPLPTNLSAKRQDG